MERRTSQDLLVERRANVQEARRTSDRWARKMLLAHVATIDDELKRRQKEARR